MAEAVVSIALQKLARFAVENAAFFSGVTDQVEEISRELKRVQFFLKDAYSRNHKEQSVRNWLREIKLLAYKVEDIIETFEVAVASNRKRGVTEGFKRYACIVCEAKSLHNIGLQLTKVKKDISDITTVLQRYDIQSIGERESSTAGNETQWWERQTYAHQLEEHFVGMEEDMEKLASMVVDDEKCHRVISIWGMGGLGKTTLARKIYKHRDVQRHFERCAWVCITQQAQIKVILQDILMQLSPEKLRDVNCMGNRELVQQIYHVQRVTKCLVVLDDIWKAEDWKSLVSAFPIGEGDSKILLTTRNKKVAEIGFPYALKCLTEKQSWELLLKIASPRENFQDLEIEQKLEDVGIDMVRKCGGLPLAISVLGGILKDKNSPAEWQMVNKYVSSYLTNTEDDKEEAGAVARVLSLSYDDLPYYLKPCFLSLGCFREDEGIDCAQLHLLWEAEGAIMPQHQRSGESLSDVTDRYLDELIRRCMVELKLCESFTSRNYHTFCLHDMMRDLCLQKSREEEFVKVIDFRSKLDPSSSTNISSRLVIHMDAEILPGAPVKASSSAQEKCQQLRSLLCLNSGKKFCREVMIWPQGIVNLEDSESLRVLHFEGFDLQGKKFPVDLRKLMHLRYLNLNDCKLDELPSSVARLPFLQDLLVLVNNEIKVPNVLWKMKKLKRLCLPTTGHYNEKGKLRQHGLDELEVLFGLDSRIDEVSDLASLYNLQRFWARVCDNTSLKAIVDCISMDGLKLGEVGLCIDGCDSDSKLNEGLNVLLMKILLSDKLVQLGLLVKMSRFPRHESGLLQNLIFLSLEGNNIEEDPTETLELLPQLRLLLLGPDSYMGKDMSFHEWGFPQLRTLQVLRLPNLESWRVENGAMPKLCSLMISGCRKLEMIPDGLEYVLSLEELVISEMPVKFCDWLKADADGAKGEDCHKIQHVPSISKDSPLHFCLGLSSFMYTVLTFLSPVYKSL